MNARLAADLADSAALAANYSRLAKAPPAVESAEPGRPDYVARQAQKMEAIGRLTGGIAHDFNNILAVVSNGYAALRRTSSDPVVGEVVANGQMAIARAAHLVRELRAFGRVHEPAVVSVDVASTIDDMNRLFGHGLSPSVKTIVDIPRHTWRVQVDKEALGLALLNLAINARDAMPGGGVMRLTARNVPGPEATAQDYVAIAIRDSGSGMSADTIDHATEPFYSTKPEGTGTGLGLCNVYAFAHQSGGTVEISSIVGQGTSVTLFLPKAPDGSDR